MTDPNHIFATAFWVLFGLVFYTYVVYPLILWVLGPFLARDEVPGDQNPPRSASVVIAAHNEEATIVRRLTELSGHIRDSGIEGQIIVVSDGSTDRTASLAHDTGGPLVRVIELSSNVGKAAALNAGCEAANQPIIIFADARQTWDSMAMVRLLDRFHDAAVGAVSGNLVLETATGAVAGVGLYWRYEKWLRGQESRLGCVMGVSGSICAVRRHLFKPIPPGTILDDVYWPLGVAMRGSRIVLESGAMAYDRLPPKPADEFRRKVRTLSGNFQLVRRMPKSLLPGVNPIWFQFVSHKLMRLAVPWFLMGMLACSFAAGGTFYRAVFWTQIIFYGIALAGIVTGSSVRLLSAAAGFVMLNSAAWVAFWVWITGQSEKAWRKAAYSGPDAMES